MSEERTTEQFEAEARKQGWRPQEEWSGPEDKWTDAKTFVENGEKIAGIAVKRSKELQEAVDTLTEEVEQLKSANQKFGQFHQEQIAKRDEDNKALLKQLKLKRAKAVEEADAQKFLETEEEIERLEAEPAGVSDWQVEWANDNKWYANDPVLQSVADGIANKLRASGSTLNGKAFLDEVSRQVKEEMPHKFENPRRSNGITGGDKPESEETEQPAEKSYEALPAEAKKACDEFVAAGIFKDRDAYVASYEWE